MPRVDSEDFGGEAHEDLKLSGTVMLKIESLARRSGSHGEGGAD